MPYKTYEEYTQPFVDEVKSNYLSIIENIGEDPSRNGILKTPERAAKAM
jgi:GTP cyclohydrolase I